MSGDVTDEGTAEGSNRSRRSAAAALHALLFVLVSALAGVLVAGFAVPIAGSAGLAARSTAAGFENLPAELKVPPLAVHSTVLAADGTEIATFYDQNRTIIPLSAVAPVMRQALIAIEDSRFYEHGGIDLRGTTRALVNNASGDEIQGGSTITQQYVKNALLEAALDRGDEEAAKAATDRRGQGGYQRKLRELRYAVALEERLSKDQILERYLNIAYMGNGTYGVEAAAQRYFSKPAAALTPAEAALLAGMVRNPSAYDPFRRPQAALVRRNTVLQRMAEVGALTPEQARAAQQRPLGLQRGGQRSGCDTSIAPFFCDFVKQTVLTDPTFGETPEQRFRLLFRGGVTLQTTLDLKVQRSAQQALVRRVFPQDKVAGAIVSIQPGSGRVQAIALSKKFGEGPGKTKLNFAVDKDLGGGNGVQAGSSFKPYLIAAALQQGYGFDFTIYSPYQLKQVKNIQACEGIASGKGYEPKNASAGENGPYNLGRATALSVNTYFIQLEERVGLCEPTKLAQRMGVRRADGNPLEQVVSWTLGVNQVSPLRMAEGYATFAARGIHCSPVVISRMTNRDGQSLAVPQAKCAKVMEPEVADAVTHLLRGPLAYGTARASKLDRPAAGKTGTTDEQNAAWFVGYTPSLTTAVALWNPFPGKSVYHLNNVVVGGHRYARIQGGTLPAPLWKATMQGALEGIPAAGFTPAQARFYHGPKGSGTPLPEPRHGVVMVPVIPGAAGQPGLPIPLPTPPVGPGATPAPTPAPTPTSPPPSASPTPQPTPTTTPRPSRLPSPTVSLPPKPKPSPTKEAGKGKGARKGKGKG